MTGDLVALEAFGSGYFDAPNRASYWVETAHPYGNNVALQTLADWDYKLLGMTLDVRAHFNQFDLDGCGGDYVALKDGVSGTTIASLMREAKMGDRWSNWGTVASGRVKVDFHSDDRNCSPAASCSCKVGFSYAYSGAALKEFELRRHQSTRWYFPPLRFPGQYFDAETDWHENWNRFYDGCGSNPDHAAALT
jgi:hypothetical protein